MRRLLLLPLLTLPALAQSALSPLKDHPLLKQAEAYLLAARKSLEAQAAPLALNVQGNYLRYGYTREPEAVSASANSTESRKPYSRRANRSRPRSSVPSQLSAEGGAGCGSRAK